MTLTLPRRPIDTRAALDDFRDMVDRGALDGTAGSKKAGEEVGEVSGRVDREGVEGDARDGAANEGFFGEVFELGESVISGRGEVGCVERRREMNWAETGDGE